MPNESYHPMLYRSITALGVVLAFLLTLLIPQHMREGSDWSFQYAAQNFSKGQLTEDGVTIGLEESEAYQFGGLLSQYILIGDNRWALSEAPGYIFYLLPFYYLHAPELGNLVLAIGMTIVAYILLKRLRDEKAACLGSLLLLFTPVALAMMQRIYTDTFGASAFLSMGGGLYIYYCLRARELSSRSGGGILFVAGLLLGWSVFANYNNALVVLVFALHFIFMFLRAILKKAPIRPYPALILGLAIPLVFLLLYQNVVFGSPWTFGFQFTQLPVNFNLKYLWLNIKYVTAALLVGFPLLLLAAFSFCTGLYYKTVRFFDGPPTPTAGGRLPELPTDIAILLCGWAVAVFGLYLNYEFTANYVVGGMPFIIMARYYLPGVLPLTIAAVLLITKVPRKLAVTLVILCLVWGVTFFAQAALSLPLMPPHSPYNPMASSIEDNDASFFTEYNTREQISDTGNQWV